MNAPDRFFLPDVQAIPSDLDLDADRPRVERLAA